MTIKLRFPAGTTFWEPDDINRVTVQFPNQDDAIVFYEWLREVMRAVERRESEGKDGD